MDRSEYRPSGGQELKFDNTVFDVSKWREDSLESGKRLEEIAESELQNRNGQDSQRVYDPTANSTLKQILKELKKMNLQLNLITGEEVL